MDDAAMATSTSSSSWNFALLESLTGDSVQAIAKSWSGFCSVTEALLRGSADLSLNSELISNVHCLCNHGLDSLVIDLFLHSAQKTFEENGASRFWRHFDPYRMLLHLK